MCAKRTSDDKSVFSFFIFQTIGTRTGEIERIFKDFNIKIRENL
jgi:hypothetical protein